MKKVILLLSFMPFTVFCQVSDNFETGTISDWRQSPSDRWVADNLTPISGTFSLHHNYDNPDSGSDMAGIPLLNLCPDSGITKWSFRVKHGCEPSSSNCWAVFIAADNGPEQMHPGGIVNGYAIGVNLAGYDDTLRLWKVKQGNMIPVLSTPLNWQNNIGTASSALIEAERSPAGDWSISVLNQSGVTIGSAESSDPELFTISWFGIYYKYSSTRDRLLWLDDISIDGVFRTDLLPPSVKKLTPLTRSSLEIVLDEEPVEGFYALSNFTINDEETGAESIIRISPYTYLVSFISNFTNKSVNTLTIRNICDSLLNCSNNVTLNFSPVWAEPGDVVLSEVMADPFPPVGLPSAEYLELRNNTNFLFDISKWKLITEGQTVIFPTADIRPGESIILCYPADTLLFSKYGRVTGLKSFPVLTDAGRCIVICDSTGGMIHGVEYSRKWYGDVLKTEGGWSLEMVDISHPFNPGNNWRASVSRAGGTPGGSNSVNGANPDRSFAGIKNVFPADETSLIVSFAEPVINFSDNAGKTKVGDKQVRAVKSADLLNRTFRVELEKPLVQGYVYSLTLPSLILDYSGNIIEKRIARFGLPEQTGRGDMVFNELLFNPFPGYPDYIELVNTSQKTIDASMLLLVSVNDQTGDTSAIVPVSQEAGCILPGAIYAITTDREALLNRYFNSADTNIFEVSQLPSMSDDAGHLLLLNRQLDLLDEVRYNEKMHYSLLAGTEGISLEKVNPQSSSAVAGNWHSASEASGWGTPGAPNSIFEDIPATEDNIDFSSRRISPDSDGYEDLLVINFSLDGYDNVLSVTVFDEGGNHIRKLAENLYAGSQATVVWDGTADDGSPAGTGIYIVFVTVFDDKGNVRKWERVCTVIR